MCERHNTITEQNNQCRECIMQILQKSVALITVLTMLIACGDKPAERALSGAGIGAGVGAVSGVLVGSPAAGAAVGGAVGAAAGGLTTKKNINLGKPVWR
jgi:osmotically inducible lipoprotein OsmB